ncbi:MAG TPA: hypothetical protein PLI15_07140 [Anaerolineales bacterium]|nr:hypothetical protein [Anaerolineales bacterium]HMV95496.1 hypothetical protein [Anaerolineales bacterium]HMZ42810.1 hypothetical protein [Anaerolineales bacterium]HNB87516.1 hypothetical protein [Anaerolineales bacterium]HND90412.1 hypothetical protein [Anaerolineales bacterium]
MQTKNEKSNPFWLSALIIFVVSAIAYLPLARKFGYLNDDWYLMYDMWVKDPSFFHVIFSGDRPGRALAMIPLFSLFGFEPLYYHLSAFLFRFLSGVSLYWTFRMLWPWKRFAALAAALLFAVYPGFLSQTNAIDYQSHILGLFLAALSVALTIKSLLTVERFPRFFFMAASILAGWGYLSQMEYFIGMEAFRFGCIFILMWRTQGASYLQKAGNWFIASLPFLLVAGGFLIWRLFFFESERKATDIGLQISQLTSSPLTLLWWLNYLVQDMVSVTLVAWGLPVYVLAFPMRLRDVMSAFGWAGLAVALMVLGMNRVDKSKSEAEAGPSLSREALILSLISIVGGLLPVILVNRHVTLPDYSRYTLIASVGAALLLVTIIEKISARVALLSFFVAIAVLTHYGNAVRAVDEAQATRDFWWQVAWRVPQFQPGVTLIASYPGSPLSEDYFIWGPANLIYYPEKQDANPVEIKLPAAVLTDDVVLEIATNGGVETPLRRGNYLERDFGNVLVMIQSRSNGCVRMINGEVPELSPLDQHRLLLIAPFSRLENVKTEGEFPTPPAVVFGSEPERGWCYFYQKADLARQRGDWEQIPVLLKEALDAGHYPEDALEWMPFLQASAVLGDVEQVRSTAKLVTVDKFLRLQVCNIMTDFMEKETLNDEVKSVIEHTICK